MNEIHLPPLAPTLIESLRAIGYSFETAIADLIDNSISAGSKRIEIQFRPFNNPFVAVIDDGCGMTFDELVQAMRHGCQHPRCERDPKDLGRFGLGLKTASLSQCRRLTVASVKNGDLNAVCWDIDVINARKDWILITLSQEEALAKPNVCDLLDRDHGTTVIWEELDKIEAGFANLERRLGELIDGTRDQLALVFHRYLSGERKQSKVEILINQNPVVPVDPYLTSHRATQVLPEEVFSIEGSGVRVVPFILPHISKLSPNDMRRAGGEEGLRRYQGFYVYRNYRLINWGTWFRLARQEELTKLARVMVEIPNTLDHLWTIDVKKSIASPPEQVRDGLRRIIDRISDRSRQVYTFRGRRTAQSHVVHAWDRVQVREGIQYRINRDHPLIQTTKALLQGEQLPLLEALLKMLEMSFPFDAAFADIAAERRIERQDEDMTEEESLYDIAFRMLNAISEQIESADRLLMGLSSMEPFVFYPELTKHIIKRLQNAR
jgi:hypothetical protein